MTSRFEFKAGQDTNVRERVRVWTIHCSFVFDSGTGSYLDPHFCVCFVFGRDDNFRFTLAECDVCMKLKSLAHKR